MAVLVTAGIFASDIFFEKGILDGASHSSLRREQLVALL